MITALFLRDDDWASDLIAWGTKIPGQDSDLTPSHVAFLFEFGDQKIVIESDMKDGVQTATYEEAIGKNRLIAAIDLGYNEEETTDIYLESMEKYVGKWYDYFGIVYFGWRIALKKLFKVKIPTKNKMSFKKMYFCSEFYTAIVGGEPEEYGMVSPNDLMILLLEKNYRVISGLFNLPAA